MSYRPRRSALYMPGSNTRALDKARGLSADVLILDLEDAVAPDKKPAALANIVDALATGGYGARELIVRVNAIDSQWGRTEIAALAASSLHGLCLPKVESPATIRAVEAQMKQAGYDPGIGIWAMIETPVGILQLPAIAASGGRLRGLIAGTNDLAAQLRLPEDPARNGLRAALSQMVVAARANDLEVLDGAFGDIGNDPGLEAECEQGRLLGFDGKTLIHPAQLDIANRVFAPALQAVQRAQQLVAAWDRSDADSGVIVVEGRMVEALHVDAARRLLAIHSAIGDATGG